MNPTYSCWILDGPSPFPVPEAQHDHVLEVVGNGVYAGFRTFSGTRVHLFGAHVLRLESGRAQVGIEGPVDLKLLGQQVADVLDQLQVSYPDSDWKVRVDLAENRLASLHPDGSDCRLVLQVWPLQEVDQAILEKGVTCALEARLSRDQPLVKGTPFSLERLNTTFPGGDNYESILIDTEGVLLEGVMSGLAFIQEDSLRTAPTGVLPSITVATLCGIAEELGLAIRREAVHYEELSSIQGAFLATSVRGVVPVVRIGDQVLGDGCVGSYTKALVQKHAERARSEARRTDHV